MAVTQEDRDWDWMKLQEQLRIVAMRPTLEARDEFDPEDESLYLEVD